jgi:hypothetical protein
MFDIMEQNLVLAENLVRETRERFDQARRMIGAGAISERSDTAGGTGSRRRGGDVAK